MASKGVKESLVNKFGIRLNSSVPKSELELERVRKENVHLKKKIDELRSHVKSPDSEKSKLLERILSLETFREKNNRQLLAKEQELQTVRQQLSAKDGEVVASLRAQLAQHKMIAEQKETSLHNLSKEMEELKIKNQPAAIGDMAAVHDQLRDALEKNQQWLVYDQQREAYVQCVAARAQELEKQLSEVMQQQGNNQTSADGSEKEDHKQLMLAIQSNLQSQKDQVNQTQRELFQQKELTIQTQAELRSQREQVTRLQEELMVQKQMYEDKCSELSNFTGKYKKKCSELEEVTFQAERIQQDSRNARRDSEQVNRMKDELRDKNSLLKEERKKYSELLQQVRVLQESLLSQSEQQRLLVLLEHQVQLSANDLEEEKVNRQCVTEELHEVLKELRKTRDDISNLDSSKNSRFPERRSHSTHQLYTMDDMTTSPKVTSLLDESFLECPNCQSTYPASRYRDLLAHIEFCNS